jgi:hypothetical protein
MIPIRLTENRWVNPSAVAEVEFRPKDTCGPDALFFLLYISSDLNYIRLKGAEAEEAFDNWTAAVALTPAVLPITPDLADQYRNE